MMATEANVFKWKYLRHGLLLRYVVAIDPLCQSQRVKEETYYLVNNVISSGRNLVSINDYVVDSSFSLWLTKWCKEHNVSVLYVPVFKNYFSIYDCCCILKHKPGRVSYSSNNIKCYVLKWRFHAQN